MKADYNGTDVDKGLSAVFNSLDSRLSRPVSIFLVTDGGQWDVQSPLAKIEEAIRTRSTPTSYLRVFTIGIGDGVSTEMCDSIARVGNGASIYLVSPHENHIGKCARLVRAARSPPIDNVKFNWLVTSIQSSASSNSTPINIFQENLQYRDDDTGALVSPRQAPVHVRSLFPATRTEIYAIVPDVQVTQDLFLTFTGYIPSTGEPVSFTTPLEQLSPPLGRSAPLHTLAAKAIIAERELDRSENPDMTKADFKEEIVHLGTTYGLTSRHTSFLAIANGKTLGRGDDVTAAEIPYGQYTLGAPETRAGGDRGGANVQITEFMTASYQPFSASAFAANLPAPDAPYVLDRLIRSQSFDGGFGEKSADVVGMLFELGGWAAQDVLSKFSGITDEVTAVVLAWVWMNTCLGDEVEDIVEKLDLWLRENAPKSVAVDELERQISETHAFEYNHPQRGSHA